MQAPSFWQSKTLVAQCLRPVSWLYGSISTSRAMQEAKYHASLPVICIGNVVAGGAGKTPMALALAKALKAAGKKPHFLSRGYGGSLQGPVQVDANRHSADEAGDEPLLLAAEAPCWVAKDRVAGAKAIEQEGAADCIIMDDGLQNPALHKDISILVIDGGYGIGNGYCIPAGPLRETLDSALKRVQLVVLIGEDKQRIAASIPETMPCLQASVKPVDLSSLLKERPLVAFAGIGRPEKFFDTLRQMPVRLAATQAFPDHHPYSEEDMENLLAQAADKGAELVTTRKDWVRVPESFRGRVRVLDIELQFEDEQAWESWLENLHG